MSGINNSCPAAIITALPLEANPIRRLLRSRPDIPVVISGIGPERAYTSAMQLAERQPSLLISAGLAGALAENLRIGDLVIWGEIPDNLSIPDKAQIGKIYCSSTPVTTPSFKRILALDSGAMAVDMESDGIHKAAREIGVPFLAVKAISDVVDQIFPIDIDILLNQHKQIQASYLIAKCLTKPSVLLALWHLWHDSNQAAISLAGLIKQIIDTIPDY